MDRSGAGRLAVVAGATGYAGGHVVRALHARGWRVRALARDAAKLDGLPCDEAFVGEATRPDTLRGLFDGADAAFSSIGIRQLHRRPTFLEVDRDANLALVRGAEAAGVRRFVFVSVLHGPTARRRSALVDARETVADALAVSPMSATVLRPSGFFNDMRELFDMARRGRVWLVGRGDTRLSPIHGADLGALAADVLADPAVPPALDVGGPDVLTMREVGELAFSVLGRPPRFGHLPGWTLRAVAAAARPVHANVAALAELFALMTEQDGVAPPTGTHHLVDFFRELADA